MTIEENVQRITEAKADIRSAIAEKGVEVSSEEKIDGYANLIRQIPTGGSGMEKFLTHTIEEINCPDVVANNAFYMFYEQKNLKKAVFKVPDELGYRTYYFAFYDCKALTEVPDFSNVTTVDNATFWYAFNGCTSLTEAPDFRNITAVGTQSFGLCFYGCRNLSVAYAPTVETWDTSVFLNWLGKVAAKGVLYADKSMEGKIPMNSDSGCPAGWEIIYE